MDTKLTEQVHQVGDVCHAIAVDVACVIQPKSREQHEDVRSASDAVAIEVATARWRVTYPRRRMERILSHHHGLGLWQRRMVHEI